MEELSAFLNNRLKERGLTVKRLAEISGIAIKHLEAIVRGDMAHIPAAPYLRGYLLKLGRILDFDGGAYWEEMQNAGLVASSGERDLLPKNRFTQKPLTKIIVVTAVLLIIVGYFAVRLPAILGKPELTITTPYDSYSVAHDDHIVIQGETKKADTLTINGEEVELKSDGTFQKDEPLFPNRLNPFEVVAHKFLGRETKVAIQVMYEPLQIQTTTGTLPSIEE